jgi:hypothetical protein
MTIPHLKKNRNVLYLVLLLGVFVASRALYDQIGLPFLGDTQHYWQFIHPSLLKTDLWRSVFYLHTQPPLFNLLAGIILQMFPAHAQDAFHILYYFIGALLAISIYVMGVQLKFPGWMSLITAALFIVSPSTMIYEHWFMYGYLIACALTVAGVALYRFAESQKTGWGIVFFFLLAVVTLTWSLFHFVWMIFIFVLILSLFPDRRKVMLAALVPLLLVFGWYTKNLVLFGEFTAASWGGMNFSRTTTFRLPEEERKRMIESGILSQFAKYPPFRNPKVYLRLLPDTPKTSIPVLDIAEFQDESRNHHHRVYLEAAKYYFRDGLNVLRLRPAVYLRSIMQSLYIFFHSASDFDSTWEIRVRILSLDVWWNRLFYGQWLSDESSRDRLSEISPVHVAWWIVASFIISVLGTTRYLWKNPGLMRQPGGLLILFMLVNVLYVTIVGNSMDIGENNRFRYVIDAFLLLLTLHVLYGYIRNRPRKVVYSRE